MMSALVVTTMVAIKETMGAMQEPALKSGIHIGVDGTPATHHLAGKSGPVSAPQMHREPSLGSRNWSNCIVVTTLR